MYSPACSMLIPHHSANQTDIVEATAYIYTQFVYTESRTVHRISLCDSNRQQYIFQNQTQNKINGNTGNNKS